MKEVTYNAGAISVLEGLECVRMRPDMYIGSPSGNPSDGLYRLCREAIDNSLDEYLGGFNNQLYILYDSKTYRVTIIDNGRGIPVGWNDKAKCDAFTAVFTKLHAGGKFNHDTYKTSAGKNGVGATAITALSKELIAWSNNSVDKKWYFQRFEKGEAKCEVTKARLPEEFRKYIKKTGTIISWIPDNSIFKDGLSLNVHRLKRELNDVQYLCPKLNIHLIVDGEEKTYYSDVGLEKLVTTKKPEEDNIFTFSDDSVDIAVNFSNHDGSEFRSFVNICYTNLGGTHLNGLRKTICNVVKNNSKVKILNEDILDGVIGAIHYRMAEPQYQGQTKNELTNSEVEKIIIEKTTQPLEKFFRKNKDLLAKIVTYAEKMLAEKTRMKDKKDILKGISKLNTGSKYISDKFLDADRRKYKNNSDLELFIVEGDSAGGHFRHAREGYQAALKIRGKMINCVKASDEDIFGKFSKKKDNKSDGNREIKDLVAALGSGISTDYNESNLRFGKVIILSDADVDGQHIVNLALSFIISYMPDLIKNGHVYIVDAPLFIGNSSKCKKFGMSRMEIDNAMKAENIKDYDVLRLKGWGECSADQLAEFCLNPKTRKLKQLKWTEETESMLNKTMGNDVAFRKILLGIEQ